MSTTKRATRTLLWTLPALWLVTAAPAHAVSKLVQMNNGKVLRADSAEPEGDWLMVTLDGGHVVGIQAALVESVTDDLGENNDADTPLNVVTSGRYVPRGRSVGTPSPGRRSAGRANNPLTEAREEKPPEPPAAVTPQPTPGRQPAGVVGATPTIDPTRSRPRRPVAGRTLRRDDN